MERKATTNGISTRFELEFIGRSGRYWITFDTPVDIQPSRSVEKISDRSYSVTRRVFDQLKKQCRYYCDFS